MGAIVTNGEPKARVMHRWNATELQHEYVVWYDDGKELAELRVFAHKPKLGDEYGDASTLAYTFAQGVNTALALMVNVKS